MEEKMNEMKLEEFHKRSEARRQRMLTERQAWPPKEVAVLTWEHRGLRCAIASGPLGNLNGYVHIPATHPDNAKWYAEVKVDVHGGLTFMCRDLDGGTWYGFDTSHYGDMMILPTGIYDGRRWDIDSVKAETERLADQLADAILLQEGGA